jgi:hypothetical protein
VLKLSKTTIKKGDKRWKNILQVHSLQVCLVGVCRRFQRL